MCGTDWQASSTTSAPTARARAAIRATGLIVPKMLLWCTKATTFVRLVDDLVEVFEVKPTIIGQREPRQLCSGALGQLLPRDKVGVMLHLGDDNPVARRRFGSVRPPARMLPRCPSHTPPG